MYDILEILKIYNSVVKYREFSKYSCNEHKIAIFVNIITEIGKKLERHEDKMNGKFLFEYYEHKLREFNSLGKTMLFLTIANIHTYQNK